MKKRVIAMALSLLAVTSMVGCGNSNENSNVKSDVKVGMVTDSGTIDDKSFNQGTWEGIKLAESDFGIETNYLQPTGTTEADYLKEIGNLYDTGYKLIITPGFKFESAIGKAQQKYTDARFVILDGSPTNSEGKAEVAENSIAIYFADQEAGFLAGLAASIELNSGELGFIGGMKIPAVQSFNWGFQQGIAYANENLGTSISIKSENVVYEGTFDNVAGGQQIAAQMYDRGVKAIFTAAGGVGVGVINEAKARAVSGKEAWVIGVDVDQYADGIYEEGKSIILTSAMKNIDTAAYDMIKDAINDEFKGGETLIFNAANNGIGIPEENPNLSQGTIEKVKEIYTMIQNGEVKVVNEQGSLIE